MKIKVLYDNISRDKALRSGWGCSCLVNDRVLFDTGESGDRLIENMKEMQVDFSAIQDVIISHDHWDHNGGLESVLQEVKPSRVIISKGFSQELKDMIGQYGAELAEPDERISLAEGITVTKPLEFTYKSRKMHERVLLLETEFGVSVLTGCAHPDILNILKKVKKHFAGKDLYSVIGGFHLDRRLKGEVIELVQQIKMLGYKKAGPCHCSGELGRSIFEQVFGSNFLNVTVGSEIEV